MGIWRNFLGSIIPTIIVPMTWCIYIYNIYIYTYIYIIYIYIHIYIFCPEHTYLVSAQFRHLQPAECHKPVRSLHKPSNLLQWFWYAWVLTLIYFVNLCQIFPTPRWLRRISSNSSLESPPPSHSPLDLCPGSLRQNSHCRRHFLYGTLWDNKNTQDMIHLGPWVLYGFVWFYSVETSS